jgi:hypothetical protein
MIAFNMLLLVLCQWKTNIDIWIPPNSNYSFLFGIFISTLYVIASYLYTMQDYFDKYWLYHNPKSIWKKRKCWIIGN